MIDRAALLERFCRYVQIDTQAREGSPSYPSTPGQWDLARLLAEELTALGLQDVSVSAHAIVTATLPARGCPNAPTIALFAHMDTSPETSGKNVRPIVHPHYAGGDIVLPGDHRQVLRGDNPELQACLGKTIITTDGTTLLGADNKAGVAVIMQTAVTLLAQPAILHGPIRICFTCDEEIGKGTEHVDLTALNAVVGYTLDGAGAGEIEAETFSANKATVTIHGINLHPSIAKGRMVNAIRLAGMFLDRLPRRTLAPEVTDGRDGFLHPYRIDGGVAEVTLHILLRDFVTAKLEEQATLLRQLAAGICAEYPEASIDVNIQEQYRNMADGMRNETRAVPLAMEAMRRAGLQPKIGSIRGGTDGALFTAKGLPCPNLSTAEHNFHSPLEWTCLEEMEAAVQTLIELAQLWGAQS
jgi:tripeptide aminopeptidase